MDHLVATGSKRQTVRRRIGRGRWQEPLPSVICRLPGRLGYDQWLAAALLYGGDTAALSHGTAGAFWGIGQSVLPVHITVDNGRHLRSTDEVRVHQTRRPFVPVFLDGVVLTPPARTAIDIALAMDRLPEVEAMLGRILQLERTTLSQLEFELDCAPRRGSRNLRRAVASMAAGSRAASEARLWRLLEGSGLPLPEMNAPVATPAGTKYVDALWRHLGKGVEVDGQSFHFDPASWRSDLARQNAIQTSGIMLLRIAARRLWTEPDAVLAEIAQFLGLPL